MKVCPDGWHLPTKQEWHNLVDYYGNAEIAGGKLKSKDYWFEPNEGVTEETLFKALPSGFEYDGKAIIQVDSGEVQT